MADKNALDKLGLQVLRDLNRGAFAVEIPDEQHVHLTDDSAFVEIADRQLVEGDTPSGVDSAFQTDFEHDFEMRERAYRGPNGQKLDDLDQAINLRQMQREEAAKVSPHRNVNPASWDSGILGGQAIVPANSAALGQAKEVVMWVGEDREALPVLITLRPRELPTPAGGAGIIRPFARIRWGTRNGEFVAHVDVGTGVQLALGASSVYVEVGLDVGSTVDSQIAAALSFWSADKSTPATRTAYIDALAAGGTLANVLRPNFATTIQSFVRSDVAGAYTITMRDISLNNVGQFVVPANANFVGPVQLPNDCRSVDVTSAAAGITNGRLTWGLSF